MIRRLIAFRRLAPGHRRLVVHALLALTAVAAGLRVLGYRRCHALLARTPLGAPPGGGVEAEARAWTAAVALATRHLPWGTSCLPRSLALWWLLRRAGVASDLRIGVRMAEPPAARKLEAHAWVEHGGRPLNDNDDVRRQFPPFDGAITPQRVRPR